MPVTARGSDKLEGPGYILYGRADRPAPGAVRFDWPGTYIEARFEGHEVWANISCSSDSYFDVFIDGEKVPSPDGAWAASVVIGSQTDPHRLGEATGPGPHTVRLVLRNEDSLCAFRGFLFPRGQVLSPPPRPERRLEFIGDSFTAGMGNASPSTSDPTTQDETGRNCDAPRIVATTNADQTFAALAARDLGAEWRTIASSGTGLVRNAFGLRPGTTLPIQFEQALHGLPETRWSSEDWKPDIVVVSVGINDFSTPLNDNDRDRFADPDDLRAQFKEAYRKFIPRLRTAYGPQLPVVLGSFRFPGPIVRTVVREVVAEANASGDKRTYYFDMNELSLNGCLVHPDLASNREIADRLVPYLKAVYGEALPLAER